MKVIRDFKENKSFQSGEEESLIKLGLRKNGKKVIGHIV